MKFLQDELNIDFWELRGANNKFGSYNLKHLSIQEDRIVRLMEDHDTQCHWMERYARSMPTFNSGYRNACEPDSPVKEREDTVEFWRNVIDGAQCVLDLQTDDERLNNDEILKFHQVFLDEGWPAHRLNIYDNRERCDKFRYKSQLAENDDLRTKINEIYQDTDRLHDIVVAHAMILEKN
jgi:hypothetical protein